MVDLEVTQYEPTLALLPDYMGSASESHRDRYLKEVAASTWLAADFLLTL
jgi:hypothetical protein